MKVNELKTNVRYYIPGNRYVWFKKVDTRYWAGEKITEYVFTDVCGAIVTLSEKGVERLIIK